MDINPEFLLELLEKDLHVVASDPLTQKRCSQLTAALVKKWEVDDAALDDAAKDLFRSYSDRCFTSFQRDVKIDAFEVMKEDMRNIIFKTLRPRAGQQIEITLGRALDFGKCGPGASVGTRYTDFYRKFFCSNLTCTHMDLFRYALASVSPRWSLALYKSSQVFGVSTVKGSKLSVVPKDRKTKRTVGTEPNINMFYQLGAGAILTDLLRKGFNIHLPDQPDENRRLAKLGSIDGSYATIDLKSASDSISRQLVEYMLPREELAVLDLIRSKYIQIDNEWHELGMFSSMGNGFTFPLQTLIFAAAVKAVNRFHHIDDDKINVFGDDIICRTEVYDTLVSLLSYVGFTVNEAKSFNSGSFRESCGSDWFTGYDVRGVYLRHIRGPQDIYSAFNRLARWSTIHGIELKNLLTFLYSQAKHLIVPLDESDDAGFKLPLAFKTNRRWKGGCCFYKKLMPVNRTHAADISQNPWGYLTAALGGYVRNGRVTLRTQLTRYQVIEHKTPRWDYVPDARFTAGEMATLLQEVVASS